MPAVVYENISCGSRPYLLNPVPPNEKPSYPNRFRPRVVSWVPPSSNSTTSRIRGGPSHYVGQKTYEDLRTLCRSVTEQPLATLSEKTTNDRDRVIALLEN